MTRITSLLHEDVFKFMTVSLRILLRMRNILNLNCRENQNTHFLFSIFFPESRAFYEIMWKNMIETDRLQMTIHYGACALHAG